jgi:hypothetical protein
MMTMEDSKTFSCSIEILDKNLAHHEEHRRGSEDDIAALQLKMRTMELEHVAEISKFKDALIMSVTDLGKIDIFRSMTISNLHYNDLILEGRQRLEQLKARLVVLQEENLNLAGRLERAMIQISTFDAERRLAEEVEEENKKLRKQLREYERIMSMACRTKPGSVTTRSSREPRSSERNPPSKRS